MTAVMQNHLATFMNHMFLIV